MRKVADETNVQYSDHNVNNEYSIRIILYYKQYTVMYNIISTGAKYLE